MACRSPIFLIGYMACGKTTLGEALQEAFPGLVEFIDLDHVIERRAGMSVAQIFAHRGEAAFRTMETDALHEAAEEASQRHSPGSPAPIVVVGCGGGTPCHGSNMDLMLALGTVVWLRASDVRTASRLLLAPGQRPLVDGIAEADLPAFIARGLAARIPYYSRAHHTFDSSRLDTSGEISSTVEAFASQFIHR